MACGERKRRPAKTDNLQAIRRTMSSTMLSLCLAKPNGATIRYTAARTRATSAIRNGNYRPERTIKIGTKGGARYWHCVSSNSVTICATIGSAARKRRQETVLQPKARAASFMSNKSAGERGPETTATKHANRFRSLGALFAGNFLIDSNSNCKQFPIAFNFTFSRNFVTHLSAPIKSEWRLNTNWRVHCVLISRRERSLASSVNRGRERRFRRRAERGENLLLDAIFARFSARFSAD